MSSAALLEPGLTGQLQLIGLESGSAATEEAGGPYVPGIKDMMLRVSTCKKVMLLQAREKMEQRVRRTSVATCCRSIRVLRNDAGIQGTVTCMLGHGNGQEVLHRGSRDAGRELLSKPLSL